LHNEEPLDFSCPSDIVRGIKLRRSRWAEHTAHTHTEERTEMNTEFWWINVNVIDAFDDLGSDEMVIIKWI
jgi:hypothetical protein